MVRLRGARMGVRTQGVFVGTDSDDYAGHPIHLGSGIF